MKSLITKIPNFRSFFFQQFPPPIISNIEFLISEKEEKYVFYISKNPGVEKWKVHSAFRMSFRRVASAGFGMCCFFLEIQSIVSYKIEIGKRPEGPASSQLGTAPRVYATTMNAPCRGKSSIPEVVYIGFCPYRAHGEYTFRS